MSVNLSVIVTAKNRNDPKLKDLLYSIKQQTYKNYEVIIVTEGDSESAKAIGIKKAKGEILCILASDNFLNYSNFFERAISFMNKNYGVSGASPMWYHYEKSDNILNRYFALFGVNDPIPFYLHKNDKLSYFYKKKITDSPFDWSFFFDKAKTFGDNGFFVKKEVIIKTDLEHYYHIDNIQDMIDRKFNLIAFINMSIWHRTGGNIFKFFIKRYKYADKFDTPYRRWHMIETRQDKLRLLWFIFCTIILIQPLWLSFKGYRVIKDKAWFLHPIVCWFTLITYGLWIFKRLITSIFR